MSGAITAVTGVHAAENGTHVGGRGEAQASGASASQGAATAAPQLTPNPSLRIDSALALVVIEFHGSDGRVENSIPTAQQLEAYRRGAERAAGASLPGWAAPLADTPGWTGQSPSGTSSIVA